MLQGRSRPIMRSLFEVEHIKDRKKRKQEKKKKKIEDKRERKREITKIKCIKETLKIARINFGKRLLPNYLCSFYLKNLVYNF